MRRDTVSHPRAYSESLAGTLSYPSDGARRLLKNLYSDKSITYTMRHSVASGYGPIIPSFHRMAERITEATEISK
jgi:hypothetical protein